MTSAAPGLALFDFDGTLTRRDSMFAYVRMVAGPWRFLAGLVFLGPLLLAHRAGLVSAQRAKTTFLLHFLAGHRQEDLEAAAERLVPQLDADLRPDGLARLTWHRAQGHEVRVVSASLDLWLDPWLRRHGLVGLTTAARWEGGRFAGLGGPNNNGPEKARRVRQDLDLDRFQRVWAYGDSKGDRELLALAHEPGYRAFTG
jgi:HAD superfamily hydrolase (TIGR01490 family)